MMLYIKKNFLVFLKNESHYDKKVDKQQLKKLLNTLGI